MILFVVVMTTWQHHYMNLQLPIFVTLAIAVVAD